MKEIRCRRPTPDSPNLSSLRTKGSKKFIEEWKQRDGSQGGSRERSVSASVPNADESPSYTSNSAGKSASPGPSSPALVGAGCAVAPLSKVQDEIPQTPDIRPTVPPLKTPTPTPKSKKGTKVVLQAGFAFPASLKASPIVEARKKAPIGSKASPQAWVGQGPVSCPMSFAQIQEEERLRALETMPPLNLSKEPSKVSTKGPNEKWSGWSGSASDQASSEPKQMLSIREIMNEQETAKKGLAKTRVKESVWLKPDVKQKSLVHIQVEETAMKDLRTLGYKIVRVSGHGNT